MEGTDTVDTSPYELIWNALDLIPISHYFLAFSFILLVYFLAFSFILLVFLYNFLEIHFFHDLFFTGLRGDPVKLVYASGSDLYQSVAAKCRILHGRYLATPWLASPHLQTVFLSFFGKSPDFGYKRQLFHTVDGGTLALDWLKGCDAKGQATYVKEAVAKNDKTPIMIIIPGLTSDSNSAYVKHLAFKMAGSGWNVVVSNHRGLGGVSITSDCFYNAGWTEDIRKVVEHIHQRFPEAPIFVVGTSIGANILVKFLAEEGNRTPIVGAAAVCSPWDLLICDRFINRRPVQKLYARVLTIGLQGYAQLHQAVMTRLLNWDSIIKSRSVRDFDDCATRVLGKYETVDTYYRRCSSANFVGNVSVPLLCISALDDPVCTSEAIPWDECRANKNIILAVTKHGGHLPYYEGITATSMWWVRALHEFFGVLYSSPLINRKPKIQISLPSTTLPESSIDQGPYVNIVEDGMVAAACSEKRNGAVEDVTTKQLPQGRMDDGSTSETEKDPESRGTDFEENLVNQSEQSFSATIPVRRCINQLSKYSKRSFWLLAYIAIMTTWPLVGSALLLVLKKKFKKIVPEAFLRR